MEPLGVHHIAIKALDIRRTAAFYVDVLGLTETHRNVDDQGLRSLWLRAGTTTLMVERASSGERPATAFSDDTPGLHLVAFAITPQSRPDWAARLRNAGHAIVHETDYTLYVQDPEGNRVGLSSWPETSRVG